MVLYFSLHVGLVYNKVYFWVLLHLKNHLFFSLTGPRAFRLLSDSIYMALFFYETHNSDLPFVTLPFSSQSALRFISNS